MTNGLPVVEEVGRDLFLSQIVRSSKHPIHTHLIGTLLSLVQLERDGEAIQRSSIRDCVDFLLRLENPEAMGGRTVYVTSFEPEFLRRSKDFYGQEAVAMLERGDAPAYLRNVSGVALGHALIPRSRLGSRRRPTGRQTTCRHLRGSSSMAC